DAVGFIERVGEESDAKGGGRGMGELAGEGAQEAAFFVLMEEGEVIGEEGKLLAEQGGDDVEEGDVGGGVDGAFDAVGERGGDVAVDEGDEVEEGIVIA